MKIKEIETLCDEVLNTFKASVRDYKAGKIGLIGALLAK